MGKRVAGKYVAGAVCCQKVARIRCSSSLETLPRPLVDKRLETRSREEKKLYKRKKKKDKNSGVEKYEREGRACIPAREKKGRGEVRKEK